ncbi:ABC transporter permease [Nonomuraea sp. LPB2021202275-12-8]|uniref:ABC transporter permease n=1 Tax=Nonomuraea sp. LPB2021202275-12-8 TaxID=3120159 RepID=UPI00300D40B8
MPRDPRGVRERWSAFRASAYLPATVLVLIVSAGAGLFAGSYTYAMANPTPHQVPMAVVGTAGPVKRAAFVAGMENELKAALQLQNFPTFEAAVHAVDQQQVFGVIQVEGHRARLNVASAAGATVAELLSKAAPEVGARIGVPVTVRDLKPLQPGDPRGLALFYISLAAVVVGFIGAAQLSTHASGLGPVQRIGFTVAYALLGGFAIAAVVDWLLGALRLPFMESWLILVLTMFTSGMVFTMFHALIGRWALVPTWGLMVLVGNPSSGGAVSWPLLPSPFGAIGRWLPPGASVNAQHTAVYFGGDQHPLPFLVLAAWAVVSCAVFLAWRRRQERRGSG